ncbi:MAG: phosphate acyltransferase, partial [Betaproteobacteria bacterium]
MGAMLCTAVEGKKSPTVGLLNIGSEDIKGNDIVKSAGELLKASHLNFFGNVEGTDIYKGTTDVVVCDGFVGNVMLKTSEGMAKMMGDFMRAEYKNGLYSRLAALISLPVIKRFQHRMDHRRYNGAALLGLRGVVVKSHGSADDVSFAHALERAASEVEHGLLGLIATEIERLHADGLLAPRSHNDAQKIEMAAQ